jgi:sulfatase-like protein
MEGPTPASPHHRDTPPAGRTAQDRRDLAGVTRPPAGPSGRVGLRGIVAQQLLGFLDLFVLAGFVVAQPLLDVIGRSPDLLRFRQADARDIVLLGVALTLVPPLVLGALEVPARLLGRRVHRLVHLAVVAGLLVLLGLEVAKKVTELPGPALVALSVLAGLGGGLLYARAPVVRLWLRWLWPAPIAFLLVFLLLSPAAELLRSPPAHTTAAPGASNSGRQGPIVVVLMDEFPLMSLLDDRGRIDRRLYPNFDRLAGGSTWYRNATAVSGLTNWAFPAMLTGRYPTQDRLPIASQFPDNLFTLLGGSYRYKMRVFEGTSQLCPPSTCPDAKRSGGQGGLPGKAPRTQGGLRGLLRDSARVWTQITWPHAPAQDPAASLQELTVDPAGRDASADPTRRALIAKGYTRGVGFKGFVSSIGPAGPDQRALYFVHALIPHQPWKYLPSGRKYPERTLGPGGLAANGRWTAEPWPVQSTHQRHLMQTAIADRMLGDLLQRLRATGLYDRSLLVVTADHGMAFKPGQPGRASVVNQTAPDVLWVPLFIKRPGQRAPSVTDANWEHVDLVPTIADLMGLRVPWPMDGVSWANPAAAKRPRTQKWFYPQPGDRRVLDGPASQAVVLQGVTDRLLRPQDGYLGWFKAGGHADLVGRRVDDLPIAGSGGAARVIGLDEYRHVDLAGGMVPAHVAGQLTRTAAGMPPRPAVVVAVNGVIGGASETFAASDARPLWFTAMVPDSLMHPGDNKLQLFLVDTTRGRQRLHPLAITHLAHE